MSDDLWFRIRVPALLIGLPLLLAHVIWREVRQYLRWRRWRRAVEEWTRDYYGEDVHPGHFLNYVPFGYAARGWGWGFRGRAPAGGHGHWWQSWLFLPPVAGKPPPEPPFLPRRPRRKGAGQKARPPRR